MKTKHIFFFSVLSTVALSACKKYEDGPRMSLHTKKARVANVWKYESVTDQHGTDITSNFVNQNVEFKKDGNYIVSGSGADAGTWQFASDKEDIVLTTANGSIRTWHILKLKNKELWVHERLYSSEYDYHLISR